MIGAVVYVLIPLISLILNCMASRKAGKRIQDQKGGGVGSIAVSFGIVSSFLTSFVITMIALGLIYVASVINILGNELSTSQSFKDAANALFFLICIVAFFVILLALFSINQTLMGFRLHGNRRAAGCSRQECCY